MESPSYHAICALFENQIKCFLENGVNKLVRDDMVPTNPSWYISTYTSSFREKEISNDLFLMDDLLSNVVRMEWCLDRKEKKIASNPEDKEL
ncbi:hypothetical protein Tco_1517080 [Tanacetum coccineum]